MVEQKTAQKTVQETVQKTAHGVAYKVVHGASSGARATGKFLWGHRNQIVVDCALFIIICHLPFPGKWLGFVTK